MSVYEGVAWLRPLLRNGDRYAQCSPVQITGDSTGAVFGERLLTHPLWVLVDNGSGKFMDGFAGFSHLFLCTLRLSARP